MKADRPSATAQLIAASLAYLARDPLRGRFVPPDAAAIAARCVEASPGPLRALLPFVAGRPLRLAVGALERAILPGILLHYALRKRYLEEIARQALASGVGQLVVLGAGFDPLATRLAHDFPAATCIEIDHPATQGPKRRALAAGGLLRPNLALLPADLARDSPARALGDCPAHDPGRDTLFIAEGLLMYLERPAVAAIFRAVRDHGGPRGRIAFTCIEPQADGRLRFDGASPLLDRWLDLRGEPFRWGLPRARLATFLRPFDLAPAGVMLPATFRRTYLARRELAMLPLATGEYACLATRAGG